MEIANNQICRICLEENIHNSQSIFEQFVYTSKICSPAAPDDTTTPTTITTSIADIITECTKYPASKDDKLPAQICTKCKEAAESAHTFKLLTEQAYCRLKTIYDRTWSVHKEDSFAGGATLDNVSSGNACEKSTQTERVSMYQCDLCSKHCLNEEDLKQHRVLVHVHVGKKCGVCGEQFSHLGQLKIHLSTEHPDEGVRCEFICYVCNRQFVRKDHWRRHLLKIHQVENLPVSENDPKVSLEEPEIQLESPSTNIETEAADKASSNTFNTPWVKYANDKDDTAASNPFCSDNDEDVSHGFDNINDDDIRQFVETISHPDISIKEEYKEFNEHTSDSDDDFNDSPIKNQENSTGQKNTAQKQRPDLKTNKVEENRCEMCSRVFIRHNDLQRHMITKHTNVKRYVCSVCDRGFSRSDHLSKHIQSVHGEKIYRCDQCPCSYGHHKTLREHIERLHTDKEGQPRRQFICDDCGKKFKCGTHLSKHRLFHTEGLHACIHCSESFPESDLLIKHQKAAHAKPRNFLCYLCGDSFQRSEYLKVHMRRHTGEKPFKCQFCEKAFARNTDRKCHEKIHTGEKLHTCHTCGKSFSRPYRLKIHIRSHTGERPYKCSICPKEFSKGTSLTAHIRRHTGERFRCDLCSAAFIHNYDLTAHKRTAHPAKLSSLAENKDTPPLVSNNIEINTVIENQGNVTHVTLSAEIQN